MKTVEIIERIEGEAKLNCTWKNNLIDDARIEFLNFRGFEYILQGKSVLDALIYTPRVCGICGQAHLKATVEALENVYENLQEEVKLTNKAKLLREIGLNIEIVDSHLKWFYMFIMPDIIKLAGKNLDKFTPITGEKWLKGSAIASETIKSLAIIGGQWPHTSYMIPGGVVSDPTLLDLSTMQNYLDSAISFFEDEICGVCIDKYLSFSKLEDMKYINQDLKEFYELSLESKLHESGKSHNNFIVLGKSMSFKSGKSKKRSAYAIDLQKVVESNLYTYDIDETKESKDAYGWAKTVKYADNFYETGPLARAIVQGRSFIKDIHKNFEDSTTTRVLSRMDELAFLLYKTKELIKKIDISEESFIKPKLVLSDIKEASGKSAIEACRGSLYHNISISDGKISSYDIITPTVWNLGPGSKDNPAVAQKAIIGSDSFEKAKIILRSFDVCSVCTTH